MPPGAKAQAASPENAAIVQGSRAMTTAIRPDLSALRRMPTLHRVAESWGKLELKLETDDTRYWLTTEGVSRKTSGMPINYVVDYVTVEKRSDDGDECYSALTNDATFHASPRGSSTSW